MSKKFIFTSSTLFAVMLVTTMVCFAFTLLTKDEALKQVFWSIAQIEISKKGWVAVWFMNNRVRNQPKSKKNIP